MAVGGSIESVTLDGRTFAVAADADAQIKIGGYENEVQANGDGSARLQKTRVPLSISGLVLSVDQGRGDSEYLQELQDRKGFFPGSVTLAGGDIWQGRVQITDEAPYNTMATTQAVGLGGTGKLSRQTITV